MTEDGGHTSELSETQGNGRLLRDQLLADEAWYTSEQVSSLLGGTRTPDSDDWVDTLRRNRGLLAVEQRGQHLYPAFQFDRITGQPLPGLAALLSVLPGPPSNRAAVFWLFQPTGNLNGDRPADRLQTTPEDVFLAAQKDFVGDPDGW
jgi:hypothetical protein